MRGTDTVVLDDEFALARAVSASLVAELDRSLATAKLELPSLPEVALKIRRALADADVSLAEIARLLGSDPALAARVLKTANSALFYRGTRPITSLRGAVSRLGHGMVRNVALSFAAQQAFIGYGSRTIRMQLTAVWQHSVHVAALAHMLARARTSLEPDEAFLAGLLHEVGKLYILMRAKDHKTVLEAPAAFQSVLEAWHPRIGKAVIEAWELSPELATAVGEHQNRALAAPEPPTLADVVAVANYLAERSDAATRDPNFYAAAPSFGSLSMDEPTFDWLVRAGDVDVRLLMVAFGV
jgi:HD-like signal output (HDOD) protein